MDMDWNIVEGNWKQFKGKVKQQWGKLTDDPLDMIACKRAPPARPRQATYGITRDQAELQLKAFEKLYEDSPPQSLRAAASRTMRA
jgi:uncharacterized protein YjbJ (UPF0337 family)